MEIDWSNAWSIYGGHVYYRDGSRQPTKVEFWAKEGWKILSLYPFNAVSIHHFTDMYNGGFYPTLEATKIAKTAIVEIILYKYNWKVFATCRSGQRVTGDIPVDSWDMIRQWVKTYGNVILTKP